MTTVPPHRHAELDSASVKAKMPPSTDSGSGPGMTVAPLLLIPLRKVLGVGGFHLADGFYKTRNHSKV